MTLALKASVTTVPLPLATVQFSLAGWVSLTCRISGLGAESPVIGWLFCQAATFAGVTFACLK